MYTLGLNRLNTACFPCWPLVLMAIIALRGAARTHFLHTFFSPARSSAAGSLPLLGHRRRAGRARLAHPPGVPDLTPFAPCTGSSRGGAWCSLESAAAIALLGTRKSVVRRMFRCLYGKRYRSALVRGTVMTTRVRVPAKRSRRFEDVPEMCKSWTPDADCIGPERPRFSPGFSGTHELSSQQKPIVGAF